MPASEKTWRDQKTLHVVFGCTGLLLFVATIWMFIADHNREWKGFQRKMRDVDVRLTTWRMQATQAEINVTQRTEYETELDTELASAPDKSDFDNFTALLTDESQVAKLQSLYDRLVQAGAGADRKEATSLRSELQQEMEKILSRARFEEDDLLSQRKFRSADYDEKRAIYDLGIRDSKPQAELDALQKAVEVERDARAELTLKYQAASDHRKQLDTVYRRITARTDELKKNLGDLAADYNRLVTALDERRATYFTSTFPYLGKRILEAPILDAFNSPLKIENLWTDNLKILNGSFGSVRRFDRCTTCHKAIDRTAPGSAITQLYEAAHVIEFELPTPAEQPSSADNSPAEASSATEASAPTLSSVYGLNLSAEGLVDADDVTIRQILPESLAARAKSLSPTAEADGLAVGDVLAYVRDDKVHSIRDAERFLLEHVKWGTPVRLRVVRGLPQPYASHPRMDLFVGSLSPHKISVMGCTVCHEGQGSATDFKWSSHTPNTPEQQEEWIRKYGWFNNHHWIFPMTPDRFTESTCLKCHHDVVELELATNFTEPPAPKLMKGYHLIEQYGCYGCHEISGYNGPENRIGPDMRLEPNFFAAAAQLKMDPNYSNLSAEQQGWVEELIQHPERDATRQKLLQLLRDDTKSTEPQLTPFAHGLITALSDVEVPGDLRKVGPSLRHIAQKVGPTWLYDWLRDPTHFRPTTKMPRFFGLWDHLDEGEKAVAERYEPIEILGLVTYLLKESQPLELPATADSLAVEFTADQLARGKQLFEIRGCLSCHSHAEFPGFTATQGPDLSNLGDKFDLPGTPDARRWLYSWLKNPSLYHPRTKMPDLYLDPISSAEGETTDPAADIASYLLQSSTDWQPAEGTAERLTPIRADLDALVKEHLQTKLFHKDVDAALASGEISAATAANLSGAEARLTGELTDEKKLLYIGEKTISKYGCYACHDIPGFENAKPIGTGLADWGRKESSKLAFEHIAEYLSHGHGHPPGHGSGQAPADQAVAATADPAESDEHGSSTVVVLGTPLSDIEIDEEFYIARIMDHDRTGFIWQKLKEPRSYDFAKARNKDSYNDRLRMPLFPLNDVQREAVITFVLGLVAEPPAHEFVYHADERQQTLIAGHKALIKYNCVGCHIIEPEKWTLEVPAGVLEEQPSDPAQTFPFMPHHFPTDAVAASATPDRYRGTIRAVVQGMPEISGDNGLQRVLDEEGDEVEEDGEYDPQTLLYPFELWRPALLDGNTYQVGVTPIELSASWILNKQPTFGGDLTKWLLPRAVELEKEANPQVDGKQAYGWLPPPLINEGQKVQSDWLHSFLLEPSKIRPAALMRMPKFNMSPQEATDLVGYFAAKDNAEYPYEFSEANQTGRLDTLDEQYAATLAETETEETASESSTVEQPVGNTRFDHAMRIVTSNDYCVQCHIVGDFVPKTSDRAMAPDLSVVNSRLRPDFLKPWLANPKQLLPYTPMPVNIKYNVDAENLGGVDQKLYHGSSIEQLNALVDLLMNYPRYAKSQSQVSRLVKSTIPAAIETNQPNEEADRDEVSAPDDAAQ